MNTTPQAVKVTNEVVRPLADRFCALVALCESIDRQRVAQDWSSAFPADAPADEINDGARVDGRTVLTNADIRISAAGFQLLLQMVSAKSADDVAALSDTLNGFIAASGGRSLMDVVSKLAVNAQVRPL